VEAVRALPGVTAAGVVNVLPLSGNGSNSTYSFEDFPLPPDTVPPLLGSRYVSPDYFQALGIPLVAGRTFGAVDPARSLPEVIVSQNLAERLWHGQSPLGRRLISGLGSKPGKKEKLRYTIVGVVGSVRDDGLEQKTKESIYFPLMRPVDEGGDAIVRNFTLAIRGPGDPVRLVAPVRAAIRSLDPNLPLAQVRPMPEVVAQSMARTSFTMLLLAIAAAVAILLGAVGIYGVIAYIVSQRTREIGVRMALGARRQDVERMVLRQGLTLAVAGVLLGLAGSVAATRLMGALLFEVSPLDPATFLSVPVLLAAVALLASWLPARRAAGIEPLEAIRYE
jgi:putative ABC transport system permease protein